MNERIGINFAKKFKRLTKYRNIQDVNSTAYDVDKNTHNDAGCCETKFFSLNPEKRNMKVEPKYIIYAAGLIGTAAAIGYSCGKSTPSKKKRIDMMDIGSMLAVSAARAIFHRW